MQRRRLTRRQLWAMILSVPVLLVLGVFAYAQTGHAARQVSTRLSDKLGVPVKFDSLSTGLISTDVSQVQLFEPGAETPWFTAKKVKLDLSLIGAVFGSTPDLIIVEDVTASLRFDKEGDLVTKLPGEVTGSSSTPTSLPQISVKNISVTINQEGHQETSFSGVQLHLKNGETSKQMVLSGEMNDPIFGEWHIEGNWNSETSQASAKLSTKTPKSIDMETLRKVPFVNPNAWKEINLKGNAYAELFVDVDLKTQDGNYRLVMQPTQIYGHIPVAGLNLENGSGTVVARGQTIELTDVKVKTAEGEVKVHSFMDFASKEMDIFYFEAEFEGVEVNRLPEKLMLPKSLEGKATGHANFGFIAKTKGGVNTYGTGEAQINNPNLGELIEVKITDDGVQVENPKKGADPKKKDSEPKANPLAPIDDALKNASKWFDNFRKQVGPIPVKINLKNVDVSEVLKALEIDSPIKIEGKADAKLEITIPSESTDRLKGYKIVGTLSSPQLKIDNIPLDQIEAKFLLAEGKLNIKELKAKLPAVAGKTTGNLTANGSIGTESPYPFQVSFDVQELNLKALTDAKGFLESPLPLDGVASLDGKLGGQMGGKDGSLQFESDPKKTYLNLKGDKLVIGSLPIDALSAQVGIVERAKPEKGTWGQTFSLNMLSGNLLGGRISIDKPIAFPFNPSDSMNGKVFLKTVDLGQIAKAFPSADLAISGVIQEGVIDLSSPPVTAKKPRAVTADLKLTTEKLRFRGFPISKVGGQMVLTEGVLKYKLKANALGGEIDVEGQYPDGSPAPKKDPEPKEPKEPIDKPVSFLPIGRTYGVSFLPPLPPPPVAAQFGNVITLTYKDQRLSKLLADIGPGLQRKDLVESLQGLEGRVSGVIPVKLVGGGKFEIASRAQLQLADVTYEDRLIFRRGSFALKTVGDFIQIDESSFEIGDGRAVVIGKFDINNPERAEVRVELDRVNLGALPFLDGAMAKGLDTPLSGRLVTSAGRNQDWRGSGTLTCGKGSIQGVAVTEMRIPLSWDIIPGRGRAEICIKDFSASTSGGRVTGDLKINRMPGRPNAIEGMIEFNRVDIGPALAPRGGANSSLRISGKVVLGGELDASQKGLTAKIDARLIESNPFRLPVFSNVSGALGMPIDNLSTIKEGEMQAELRDGVVRLKRMTVSGDSIEAFSEGTFTLDGKLDMHVVATTKGLAGGGAGRQFAQLAQQNAGGVLSADAFTRATGLLANLTIYLDITGSSANPDVRVRSAPTIGRAAVSFFLTRAIPIGGVIPR